MTEQRHKVTAVEVEYRCDQCEEGVMRPTGLMQPTSPPKYQHKCNKCGAVGYLYLMYPCIRYERVRGVTDAELCKIAAERLAQITPDTKFLTHAEMFAGYD